MSLIGGSIFQGEQQKPEVVGHRGFRGKFPENTILAMRQGVEAGATVIETDVQLSSDGVVVICHDITTGRCFNGNFPVESTPYYAVMDQLHTKDKFQEHMPTLEEVATMFVQDPKFANVRLMLDIKRSNLPHVVPYVAKVLETVAPLDVWEKRCTFGVWKLDVLLAVEKYMPTMPVTFIGWEHRLARRFMESKQIEAISLSYAALACPGGPELMAEARQQGVDVYSWTVNDPEAMKWAVAARAKGIITDYPDILSHFLSKITDKDLMSEYFVSEPRQFYSTFSLLRMYSQYIAATCYLAVADALPWLFTRY